MGEPMCSPLQKMFFDFLERADSKLRKFFSSKAFVALLSVIAFCLGIAVYSAVTGKASPTTAIVGAITTPIQNAVNAGIDKAQQIQDYMYNYDTIQAENEALKQELAEAEQTIRDADLAILENERLRELLGIKERNRSFTFEIAEVTARSIGDWSSTLSLDKGSISGIELDDCVITEDGMVGYVSKVAPTYCEVTTVIDTYMQAGAQITRTRDSAIAQGDYTLMSEGVLKLSYITNDADIIIGDTVETSGSGGVYPKGIMIGTIEQIIPEQHGISNYAIIKPFVDVSSVKSVFVIKDFEITG